MPKYMTLTRKQLERIITYIGTDQRVVSVTIEENSNSGIGPSHRGLFHYKHDDQGFDADLTDVENW
jgi:hypothetical protein